METAQTADYALRVLLELEQHDGRTLSELSEALEVSRSVAHRITTTLRERAAVIRDPSGRFFLGPMLIALGQHLEHELATVARPELIAFARKAGETTIVSVPEGDSSVVVASEPGHDGALRVEYEVGFRQPLDRGASSLAILAFMDGALARRRAGRSDADVLGEIRAAGFARTAGHIRHFMVGIGAPIMGPDDTVVGSITVIAPESRGERLDSVVDELRDTARRIGAAYVQRLRPPAKVGR